MSTKAVIFDMDGVLLDSMRYHVLAWQKAFKPLGVDISSHEIYAREGENWRKSTVDFLKMGGYKITQENIDEVFGQRSRIFREIFRPKVFSNARSLLKMLKSSGFKLGLVTATPRADVGRMLPKSMTELFSIMVCGGDTKKGKPHPEPYLKALKKLVLKPSQAIVIENAPYGIRSCKLAKIRCIAISTSLPKRYLKEADIILKSLNEVKAYFKKQK
ncbi:HAD family hydrolase [Candidatus Omnitrophota bacterium]